MNDEPKSRSVTLNIGWLAAAAALAVSLCVLYGNWSASKEKSTLEQLQDDSAYARATRAVTWIDNNKWKLNFIGPLQPKDK